MATKPKTTAAKSNLPKDLEAAMHKALAAMEAGKAEEAAAGFDELVEKDPLMELSQLLNEGESEAALEKAEKATKAHADQAAMHYLKATAMAQMGRYEESAEALRKAISINPDYGWTFRLEPDFSRARASSHFVGFERGD